ncbi:MAG: thymidine kinase [Defluviitaleaceae bacterium]|nr:thymidine kinase [Defluviitaleaceae bacterium]MCL2238827.1 thymidine kinase [Defluviitaleaceae bacterium]
MAKLYFRYGAMNSGKTANLLMVADNYIKQGRRVVILKPAKDTRWEMVKSRAIAEALPAESVHEKQDLFELITRLNAEKKLDAVLVEEAQFLSATQVRQLALAVDALNLPVLCYGLRCSFMDGVLFEGSAALMYWADTIEEVKTVCQFCKSKATKNLLRINGKAQYTGESDVVMGDVEDGAEKIFTPVCRKHYLHPPPPAEASRV